MSSTLWMGDAHRTMEEGFISRAFHIMGHKVVSVKVIRDRGSGFSAGYGFVDFEDADQAQSAMLQLNGKAIPGAQPPQQFRLNYAGQSRQALPEYSLYVGELSSDVTDIKLFDAFHNKYPSVHAAKVVIDDTGQSKGFGFVRFSVQSEHYAALNEMQRFAGLGRKPIRVSPAVPKRPPGSGPPGYPPPPPPFGNFYGGMYGFQGYQPPPAPYYYGNRQSGEQWWQQYQDYYNNANNTPAATAVTQQDTKVTSSSDDDNLPEDPGLTIDVDKCNKEFMERSEELFIQLEASRWHPLDSVHSTIEGSSAISMIVTK